jgi:hypothetical protein
MDPIILLLVGAPCITIIKISGAAKTSIWALGIIEAAMIVASARAEATAPGSLKTLTRLLPISPDTV